MKDKKRTGGTFQSRYGFQSDRRIALVQGCTSRKYKCSYKWLQNSALCLSNLYFLINI